MKRRHLLQTLLTTASVGMPGVSRSLATPAAGLQALAEQAEASGALPGFQIAVVAEGRLIWTTARGLADASTGLATTEATGYYIASTTKCFTALAAAQRAARGDLDLQANLAQMLPQADWRPSLQADRITLRELLTHTHGIDADAVPAQLRINLSGVYRDNAELLHWLAQATPAAGAKAFAYSNLGYDLAGMAMAPTGRDGWKAQVQREVLDPLGMKHSSPVAIRLGLDDAGYTACRYAPGLARPAGEQAGQQYGPRWRDVCHRHRSGAADPGAARRRAI